MTIFTYLKFQRTMFILYDFIFIIFAAIYFPYLIIKGKWHSGFRMRFGFFPALLKDEFAKTRNIWVHTVSVGEVLAVVDLIEKIREAFPQHRIICSTVTETGNKLAVEKLKDSCLVIYAPLDFSWIVRKFISAIKPDIYISAETEIWPNLYTTLHRRNISVLQVNGRISDKAYTGYKRVRFFVKDVLRCVDIFCMQSRLDSDRIKMLGALEEKVRVAGNLKFDIPPLSGECKLSLQNLGFDIDAVLIVAGSTHPGEEEIIIRVYKKLSRRFKRLRLVIAPRHIERTGEVMQFVGEKGFQPVKFSGIQDEKITENKIVVVDTIGHLRELYSISKIVFIGKTFTVGGGQNMIEPAFFGKPVFVGPRTQNFKNVMDVFLKEGAVIQVSNEEEFLSKMSDVLECPEKAEAIGSLAKQVVKQNRGATIKTLDAIKELLAKQK